MIKPQAIKRYNNNSLLTVSRYFIFSSRRKRLTCRTTCRYTGVGWCGHLLSICTHVLFCHKHRKVSIVGSLRDREVACSASDRQGSNFESCVWRTVSSQSSHHPQEVLLAQFSLYVHKGGLKPDSFHFIFYIEKYHSGLRASEVVSVDSFHMYMHLALVHYLYGSVYLPRHGVCKKIKTLI